MQLRHTKRKNIVNSIEISKTRFGLYNQSKNKDTELLQLGDDYLDNCYNLLRTFYSEKDILHCIHLLKDFEKRLCTFDFKNLSEYVRGDYDLLLNSVRNELLTLEVIKPWQNDPRFYTKKLKGADAKVTLKILKAARENLINPPRIYTKEALRHIEKSIKYLNKHSSSPQDLKKILGYRDWFKNDLLPQSHGISDLDINVYNKILAYREMIDITADELLELNDQDMQRNQEELKRIAKEIDSTKTPQEIMANIKTNHPQRRELANTFKNAFASLQCFIKDHKIISIPTNKQPIVKTVTSLCSTAAYFPGRQPKVSLLLPKKSWSQTKKKEYMQTFNYSRIYNTAIHEAYPGHHFQFKWKSKNTDRIRKKFTSVSNSEGWAHYAEQMMLDEGFAANTKEIKLMQLANTLLTNAALHSSIKIRTGQMTLDEAEDFFIKEAYLSKTLAEIKVKRCIIDPNYICYALGKLQIVKLRKDMEAKMGDSFNLKNFHDEFMQQGRVPIKLIRRAMLHDDSPTLTKPHLEITHSDKKRKI